MPFVKSWDTDVPAARSASQLEQVLKRYGARGYTVSNNYEQGRILIGFTMPREANAPPGDDVEVRLAVDFGEVRKRIATSSGAASFRSWPAARQLAQAERVAWRHLILYCEAGLNAAATGIQTLEEAFFAHTILEGTGQRVIDAIAEYKRQLPAGPRHAAGGER